MDRGSNVSSFRALGELQCRIRLALVEDVLELMREHINKNWLGSLSRLSLYCEYCYSGPLKRSRLNEFEDITYIVLQWLKYIKRILRTYLFLVGTVEYKVMSSGYELVFYIRLIQHTEIEVIINR